MTVCRVDFDGWNASRENMCPINMCPILGGWVNACCIGHVGMIVNFGHILKIVYLARDGWVNPCYVGHVGMDVNLGGHIEVLGFLDHGDGVTVCLGVDE